MSEDESSPAPIEEDQDQAVSEDIDVEVYPLHRPPFWSMGMVAVTSLAFFLFFQIFGIIVHHLSADIPIAGNFVSLGVFIGVVFIIDVVWIYRRASARRHPLPPIRLDDDAIELPDSIWSKKKKRIPYRDILSFHHGGPSGFGVLFVEANQGLYFFQERYFQKPGMPKTIASSLRRHIDAQPQGSDQLEKMAARDLLLQVVASKRPWVTHVFLGFAVIIYLLQSQMQALGSPTQLLGWGAGVGALITDGEIYRLASASLLHHSSAHLAIVGIAIFTIGGVLERFLGSIRLVIVISFSALISVTVAAWYSPVSLFVGSSGVLGGFLGGLAIVGFRYGKKLPVGFRQTARWWLMMIVLLCSLPILFSEIAWMGHYAGLLAGALATYLVLPKGEEVQVDADSGPGLRLLALLLGAVMVIGVGFGLWRAKSYSQEDLLADLEVLLSRPAMAQGTMRERNDYAFSVAINPKADIAILEKSKALVKGAIEERNVDRDDAVYPGLFDTLATLEYRLGNYRSAVNLEIQAIIEVQSIENLQHRARLWSPMDVFATQFARFAQAYLKTADPKLDHAKGVRLFIDAQKGPPKLVAQLAPEIPNKEDRIIWAILHRGKRRFGVVQVQLSKDAKGRLVYEPEGDIVLSRDMRIEVVWSKAGSIKTVEEKYRIGPPTKAEDETPPAVWHVWKNDPEVDTYP